MADHFHERPRRCRDQNPGIGREPIAFLQKPFRANDLIDAIKKASNGLGTDMYARVSGVRFINGLFRPFDHLDAVIVRWMCGDRLGG